MVKSPYDVMDLKALRCFWAMAKHGSLTQAGIELGISEAAISQRLKSLEKYLGAKLYESRGGRVRLTPAGERTMEMAIGLFDRLDEFESSLADEHAMGTIALVTYEPVLRYLLPDIAQQFSKAYPVAHLKLLSRPLTEIVDLVRINEVDLGIRPKTKLPKELIFHPWKTYGSYLLLPKGHPLTRRGLPQIEDLMNESTLLRYPLTVHELDASDDSRVEAELRRRGLPYNVGLEVGTIESVKNYVARGLGVGVVTGICLTESDNNVFDIIEIPDELGGGTDYGVILRKDKHISPILEGILSIIGVSVPKRSQTPEPR